MVYKNQEIDGSTSGEEIKLPPMSLGWQGTHPLQLSPGRRGIGLSRHTGRPLVCGGLVLPSLEGPGGPLPEHVTREAFSCRKIAQLTLATQVRRHTETHRANGGPGKTFSAEGVTKEEASRALERGTAASGLTKRKGRGNRSQLGP